MSIKTSIEQKLKAAFTPESLEVLNESHLHAGHHHDSSHPAPFDGTGETHFRVRIVASAFSGQNRIARHRAINAALSDELAGGVHALAIEAKAPEDIAQQ
ncbi:BolA family transcriptional regulator [Aureimonas fodinaquatilis]|uniref:BolA family transcriptional regulator n=1 Tax=Aureimonas fodinaquatilis TaxID=2565783 RepID=A0A5B0DXV0_9HYPH|nr:BolA family protein [Aureimonas fodinaquatilis]KAA0971604.1 BolA family transcriptional regulator [Aureimonas fodinaquatilis]